LLYYDEMSTYIRDGPYCTFSLITSPFPGDLGRITALARLRYRRNIVFDFSHTFGLFTLPAAHCIRFFAYIWLIYDTVGTLYSIFRIHLACLRYRRHIVFDFSHTFGSFTTPSAHCIRFFTYIWLVYVTGGTLYSIFRIHLARLRYRRHIVLDFSHTFGSFTYRRHIVFGFSHTFGSFTTPSAHCIQFFTYIWLIYDTVGTLYSIFRIHLARLRYRRHIVFDFSHTFGSFTYRRHIVFDFSHTFGSFTTPSAHCIRFFVFICP
jgi:hypothetical protein